MFWYTEHDIVCTMECKTMLCHDLFIFNVWACVCVFFAYYPRTSITLDSFIRHKTGLQGERNMYCSMYMYAEIIILNICTTTSTSLKRFTKRKRKIPCNYLGVLFTFCLPEHLLMFTVMLLQWFLKISARHGYTGIRCIMSGKQSLHPVLSSIA